MRRLLCTLVLLAAGAGPSTAHAIDVRVQGTTDTTDSGLVQDVLQPGFESTYPQYRLKYVAVGTGQALTNARNGQADAVLTHAPTEEAAFVRDGFSHEPVGRAIFFNDYVITGRAADPAGVRAGAGHDAIRAFELIAAAGAAGQAVFVSRGDNSGTNVQEQLMWALADVPKHPVPDRPGRFEPDGDGDGAGTDIPDWYKKAGVGQAATVKVAEQCNFPGGGQDRCYSITDRGTLDRQQQIGAISGVQVVSDRNTPGARGGEGLLNNPFHVYAVSPSKFASVNLGGAQAFMDYLTSEQFQNALNTYPSAAGQRFFPDAFARFDLTSPALPALIDAGAAITVGGTLTNRYPGAGVVPGAPLTLQSTQGPATLGARPYADLVTAASNPTGNVLLTARPTRSGSVRVAIGRVGDLSPTTYPIGTIRVAAVVGLSTASVSYRKVRLQGTVAPGENRDNATLTVLATRLGSGGGGERGLVATRLPASGASFDVSQALAPGRWRVRLRYEDAGAVEPGLSRTVEVDVPGDATLARPALRRLGDGRLQLSGRLSPAAISRKATVSVLAKQAGRRGATYRTVASLHPRRGQRTYALRFRLRKGSWLVRTRYRHPGVLDTTSSASRAVRVR